MSRQIGRELGGTRRQDAVLPRVAELGRATAAPHGEPATAGLALPGHFDELSETRARGGRA